MITYIDGKYRDILLKAHAALWHDKTKCIDIKTQKNLWKERYHANIFGGQYDFTDGQTLSFSTRKIGFDFDSEENFMLFLLEWS